MSALPALSGGSQSWRPELRSKAQDLIRDFEEAEPAALARAVELEARKRQSAFMSGVAAYTRHPREPRMPEPSVVWQSGAARLLDFGDVNSNGGQGRPVLAVPSLINRAYILDLAEKRSLMRALAAAGLRPLLLDWGTPGDAERGHSLTDAITGTLQDALDKVHEICGETPALVGYCMGGLLTLALAARNPGHISALALLATPWDFHADSAGPIRFLNAMRPGLEMCLGRIGELPVDVLQAMFASLNPYMTTDKFRRFADMAPGSQAARDFVAVEDWLNDGVPLAAPIARECLFEWYLENAPARGAWKIDGDPVRPQDVNVPALVVIPKGDTIVPPASADALAQALSNAKSMSLSGGHIGMMVGRRAPSQLYGPLADWLKDTAV